MGYHPDILRPATNLHLSARVLVYRVLTRFFQKGSYLPLILLPFLTILW